MSGITIIPFINHLQTTNWPKALPSPKKDGYFFSVFCGPAETKTLRLAFHAPLSDGGRPLYFWTTDYLKPDMDSMEMLISLVSDRKTINTHDLSPYDYIFGKGNEPTYDNALGQGLKRDVLDSVKVYIISTESSSSSSSSSSSIKKVLEPDFPPPPCSQEQLIFRAFNYNLVSEVFLMKRSDFLDPQEYEDTNETMQYMGVENLAAIRGAEKMYNRPAFVLNIDNSPFIKCLFTDSESNIIGGSTIPNIYSILQKFDKDSNEVDLWEMLLDRLEQQKESGRVGSNATTATYGSAIWRSIIHDTTATYEEAAMASILSLLCNRLQELIDKWKNQIGNESNSPIICVTGCGGKSNGSDKSGKKRMGVRKVILNLLDPRKRKTQQRTDNNTVIQESNNLVNFGIAEALYLQNLKHNNEKKPKRKDRMEAQETEVPKQKSKRRDEGAVQDIEVREPIVQDIEMQEQIVQDAQDIEVLENEVQGPIVYNISSNESSEPDTKLRSKPNPKPGVIEIDYTPQASKSKSKSKRNKSVSTRSVTSRRSKKSRKNKQSNADIGYLSYKIAKEFNGVIYKGMVVGYRQKERYWKISYFDGDEEDMTNKEVKQAINLYAEVVKEEQRKVKKEKK